MKILDQDPGSIGSSTLSYAGLIERIEILRSALRWASKLERPEIEQLLRQALDLFGQRGVVRILDHRLAQRIEGRGEVVATPLVDVGEVDQA